MAENLKTERLTQDQVREQYILTLMAGGQLSVEELGMLKQENESLTDLMAAVRALIAEKNKTRQVEQ